MKKIICFDNWTQGVRHFSRLSDTFYRAGFKLILIHIGSWGHDLERPSEEFLDNLTIRDISFYDNKSFLSILKYEKPKAIIFLSTRSPAFMAFNRAAKFLDIPTCHLYHGLRSVQPLVNGVSVYKKNNFVILRNLFNRFDSYFFKILPVYFNILLKTKAPLKIWIELFNELINRVPGINFKRKNYLIDSMTNIGCVYTNADIDDMHENYGLSKNQIIPVGNPDFIKFNLTESDLGCMINKFSENKILYIETGLLDEGFVYKSKDEFISHINDTKTKVESLGFHFLIKLKPHSKFTRENGAEILSSKNIEICNDIDFLNTLKKCRAIITEPSTAALIPAALGLTIFLASYGPLREQKFGPIFSSYPGIYKLYSISQLSNLSNENYHFNKSNFDIWMKKNLSPFPAELMPERVLRALELLIKD